VVVVEEEQNMEQMKVKCHEVIQHYENEWAFSNLEYEMTHLSHIQDHFCACYGQALPKAR